MANRDLTPLERVTLESLIDSTNLQSVLMGLSEICGEKAEHIRTNWQDTQTARVWDTAGGLLGFMVTNPTICRVSA